jgi:hypothetical protein
MSSLKQSPAYAATTPQPSNPCMGLYSDTGHYFWPPTASGLDIDLFGRFREVLEEGGTEPALH